MNGRIRILIVDDEELIIESVKSILDRTDFNPFVTTATTVDDAIEALRVAEAEPFDLVITDFELFPKTRSGGDLVTRAVRTISRRINASTKVAVYSGAMSSRGQEIRHVCCADGYLSKPFTANEIIKFVSAMLAHKLKAPEAPAVAA